MTSTLQLVDTNLSSVLLDLNGTNTDEYGSVTWTLFSDPEFSAPTYASDRSNYVSADGGTTSQHRAQLSQMRFRVLPSATSTDNLTAGINRLASLLALGGTVKWVPHGSANTRYRDFEPSETPVLYDGRELAIYNATVAFRKAEGVTLQLTVQPFFYGPTLDSSTNLLANATLTRDVDGGGTPDGWTLTSGTAAIQAASESVRTTISATTVILFQEETATGTFTASVDARRISGDRNVRLQLLSQPSATVIASSDTTSANWSRLTVSGATSGGDTAVRIVLRYNGGTNSTVAEWRNAQLETGATATAFHVGTETVNADPTSGNGRVALFYNPGSAPTPVNLTYDLNGHAKSRLVVARRSNRGVVGRNRLVEYANARYLLQAEALTAGTDTATAAGGSPPFSGAGSNVMSTTFATINTLVPTRVSTTISTTLDALRGHTWQLWAHVGPMTVANTTWTIRASYGLGGVKTTSQDRPVVFADATLRAHMVNMMDVYVPPQADAVELEFNAKRDSGTANLAWDAFFFVPTEQVGAVYSTVTTTANVQTAPSVPAAYRVDAAGDVIDHMSVAGHVPFVAEPGLNAVYVNYLDDTAATGMTAFDFFASDTLSFSFAPRYHT